MPTRETFTPSPSPSGKDEGPVVITAEIKQAFSRKESVECPHEVAGLCVYSVTIVTVLGGSVNLGNRYLFRVLVISS